MTKSAVLPLTACSLAVALSLTGCNLEDDCDRYQSNVALDRNQDGQTDYRLQFIGDSIVAYHDIACSSMGQQVGSDLGEKILTRAIIGARLDEIRQQYLPPPDSQADYDWVIINGGINDLTADEAGRTDLCDCNGNVNHQACLGMIADLGQSMAQLVEHIEAGSNTNVAIMTYYPPADNSSFIGACFPYVEALNDQYRFLAYADPRLSIIETYGTDIPLVQKVDNMGLDGYHPTVPGAGVLAEQTIKALQLQPLAQ